MRKVAKTESKKHPESHQNHDQTEAPTGPQMRCKQQNLPKDTTDITTKQSKH